MTSENKLTKSLWALIALTVILRILLTIFLPISLDGAYYQAWGRHPDWGYFDHPPMIAWLLWPSQITSNSFLIRLPSLLLATATIPICLSIGKVWGLSKVNSLVATLIIQGSLFGLVFGVIPTPDVPLVFFWILAIHEASKALKGQEKRWLTAGLFTGLGILGKYTMTIIGLVFLWPLLFSKQLRKSPYPYLGGLACLITILPHLVWNGNHDWVTFRFQFNRGLMSSYDIGEDRAFMSLLPSISPSQVDPKGAELVAYFKKAEPKPEPKKIKSEMQKFRQRVLGYWGAQLAVFGFLLPLLLFLKSSQPEKKNLDPNITRLLIAGAIAPLAIFGIVALFQKVEANWTAPFIVSSAFLIAQKCSKHQKLLKWGAAINMVLLSLFAIKGIFPTLPIFTKLKPGRIEKETHGYKELAAATSDDQIVLAETYQLASILGYYRNWSNVGQWPGLTRHSEWTRRQDLSPADINILRERGGFELVTHRQIPPKIKKFHAITAKEVRNCFPEILITDAWESKEFIPDCQKYLNRWYIYNYAPN